MDIQKVLYNHSKWLAGESDGIRANLRGADLSGADLSGADLRSVDLRDADLSFANLNGANLINADLRDADLSNADLSGADLRNADLSGADLSAADLRRADLLGADLRRANLRLADLSGVKNLLSPSRWMEDNFEHDDLGYIVYKAIDHTFRRPPEHWRIEPGAFLEEVPNPLPMDEYGCGVNFATFEWVRKHYSNSVIWRCRIHWADLPSVVIPYNTDGRGRCSRLELLEIVA